MATTEKYGLFVGEANDPFSPLIQFNENMRAIDSRMWENNQRGVRVVSEIKTGRVHELTTVSGAGNMMRFVATANWESGDSCTVDGTAVTTLLPSGQPLPNGAWVINSNVLCCLVGTVLTVFTYYIGDYAPGGYGLGDTGASERPFSEIDDIWKNGWYRITNISGAVTGLFANNATLRCDCYNDGECLQTLYPNGGVPYVLQRRKYSREWSEWEWFNPPMAIGTTYKTIKRYKGLPVYTRLVSIGKLPNTTTMNVSSIVPNVNEIVSYEFHYSNSETGASFINNSYITELGQSGDNSAWVRVTTPKDLSAFDGFLVVEYTKK